jgi:hypothetical protein
VAGVPVAEVHPDGQLRRRVVEVPAERGDHHVEGVRCPLEHADLDGDVPLDGQVGERHRGHQAVQVGQQRPLVPRHQQVPVPGMEEAADRGRGRVLGLHPHSRRHDLLGPQPGERRIGVEVGRRVAQIGPLHVVGIDAGGQPERGAVAAVGLGPGGIGIHPLQSGGGEQAGQLVADPAGPIAGLPVG